MCREAFLFRDRSMPSGVRSLFSVAIGFGISVILTSVVWANDSGAGEGTSQTTPPVPSALPIGMGDLLMKLGIALIVVVGLILLLQRIARQFGNRFTSTIGGGEIDLLCQRTMGPRQSLAVVRVMGQTLLVGVSPQGIQKVSDLTVDAYEEQEAIGEVREDSVPAVTKGSIWGRLLGGLFTRKARGGGAKRSPAPKDSPSPAPSNANIQTLPAMDGAPLLQEESGRRPAYFEEPEAAPQPRRRRTRPRSERAEDTPSRDPRRPRKRRPPQAGPSAPAGPGERAARRPRQAASEPRRRPMDATANDGFTRQVDRRYEATSPNYPTIDDYEGHRPR